MDFTAQAVAEQLTRMDAVSSIALAPVVSIFHLIFRLASPSISCLLTSASCLWPSLLLSGPLCEGCPIPLCGMCLVPARQEGEPRHRPNGACHHRPVQRRHQPGDNLTAVPPASVPWQLPPLLPQQPHTQGQGHREVDRCGPGQCPLSADCTVDAVRKVQSSFVDLENITGW